MDVKVISLSHGKLSKVDSRFPSQRRETAANGQEEELGFSSTFEFEQSGTPLSSLAESLRSKTN